MINAFFKKPAFHILFLMILLFIVMLNTRVHQLDDGFLYQEFAEKLVKEKRMDFSVPGFHGPSFFAALVYLFTRSSHAINYSENLIALLTIPIIYVAVRELYQDKFRGVLASYIYVLMPGINMTGFRGWSWTSTTLFSFLTIYLLWKKPRWSWISWGIAIIIKVFPIALAPFFIYKKRYKEMFLALIIPLAYVILQYLQIGKIFVGAHPELSAQKLFNLSRLPANIAFAFQSYFSVHNYTPYNPVYYFDMIHFSPFITFFALLAIIYYKKYFENKRLFLALLSYSIIAFFLTASFFYFDRYYFTLFDWSLVILSVAVIPSFLVLLPIVALHSWFQFFYFYLEYKDLFWPNGTKVLFLIPIVIFLVSLIYIIVERKKIKSYDHGQNPSQK